MSSNTPRQWATSGCWHSSSKPSKTARPPRSTDRMRGDDSVGRPAQFACSSRRRRSSSSARRANPRSPTKRFLVFSPKWDTQPPSVWGLSLAVSPATIPLPPEVVRQPLHAPELGALNPKYRAHFPRSGSPTFVFEGWRSEPRVLEALGGHVVSFSVDEPLSVEDAKAVGPVIRRLVAADETLRTAFADALFERYSAYCARFEPDELIDYGIPVIATPVDVWDHVGLDRRPRVVPSARPAPGAVSEGAAYVEFHCGCAWDREHGVRIVVDDRMQGLAGEDGKQ